MRLIIDKKVQVEQMWWGVPDQDRSAVAPWLLSVLPADLPLPLYSRAKTAGGPDMVNSGDDAAPSSGLPVRPPEPIVEDMVHRPALIYPSATASWPQNARSRCSHEQQAGRVPAARSQLRPQGQQDEGGA